MFSHLDKKNQPAMVDVSAKKETIRTALAEGEVYLPPPIIAEMRRGEDLEGPKGPIFQTAIVAGTMAAKRTGELIPLCHPLPVEGCEITARIVSDSLVRLRCQVKTSHKTGVEMEALTGVAVAALTLYDMCKALSPEIEIRRIRLLRKTGGKKDYERP